LLTFSLTSDKLHLELVSYSHKSELKDFQFYFKKRQKGYLFNRLYKRKLWDGYDHFVTLDKETGIARIGVGLWKEILNFSKKYGYQVNIQDLDSLFNIGFTKDQVDKFSSVMLDGSDIDARDYQLEAVFRALKYKFCSLELATSAGKTIIFFLYLAFLKRKGILKSEGQKALIVVPRSGLVGQTAEKFEGDYNTGLMKFNVMSIGGKNKFKEKDFESADIVISTYQSLINRPPEFFKNFRIVCVDECLHPDSMITMADSTVKKIADVNIGDYVVTKNDKTGELQNREVEYVYKNLSADSKLYEIELENGTVLKITGNHKVRLTSGEWVRVDELSIHDDICADCMI
jgi:hypothetical protein